MCRSLAEGGRRCPSSRGGRCAGDELAEVAAAATEPESSSVRLYGGQTCETDLVTTAAGARAVRKVPQSWHDAASAAHTMDAEELAAELAEAVGAPVARVHRSEPGSVWVEYVDGHPPAEGEAIDSPAAIRLGLLDAMTGNRDRSGNVRVRDGELVGYDHGDAWLPYARGELGPFLREPDAPMRHFVDGERYEPDPPVLASELDQIRTRVEALRPSFARLGRSDWLDHSLTVLGEIQRRAPRLT